MSEQDEPQVAQSADPVPAETNGKGPVLIVEEIHTYYGAIELRY